MRTQVITRTMIFNQAGEILVLTRSKGDGWRPGQYDLPGGKVDSDDADFVAAALRETWEETGLRIGRTAMHLAVAASEIAVDNAAKPDTNYVVLGFVARLAEDAGPITLNPAEHTASIWRPVDQALELFVDTPHESLLRYIKDNGLFNEYWLEDAA